MVTGTLNLGPAPGAYWWYSTTEGWRLLDDDISNANGPVVIDLDGQSTLVFADTGAQAVYAYPYDGTAARSASGGCSATMPRWMAAPDGATADDDNGVWSCVLRSGKLARFCADGLDRVVDMPMANPSDVTFGGPDLDRLFVTVDHAGPRGGGHPRTGSGLAARHRRTRREGRPDARFRLG